MLHHRAMELTWGVAQNPGFDHCNPCENVLVLSIMQVLHQGMFGSGVTPAEDAATEQERKANMPLTTADEHEPSVEMSFTNPSPTRNSTAAVLLLRISLVLGPFPGLSFLHSLLNLLLCENLDCVL